VADDESIDARIAALKVDDLVVGAASSLASLAYAKLAADDRVEAKKAIDALAALIPVLEGQVQQDLRAALANLQVAWSDTTL
jgi:hypothetical protein